MKSIDDIGNFAISFDHIKQTWCCSSGRYVKETYIAGATCLVLWSLESASTRNLIIALNAHRAHTRAVATQVEGEGKKTIPEDANQIKVATYYTSMAENFNRRAGMNISLSEFILSFKIVPPNRRPLEKRHPEILYAIHLVY